jgi:hypothetical protein
VRLDIVCLRAARPFAFATQGARAVLLASGTLAPHEPLAHELGLDLPPAGPTSTNHHNRSGLHAHAAGGKVVSAAELPRPATQLLPPPVRSMAWATGKSCAVAEEPPPNAPGEEGEASEEEKGEEEEEEGVVAEPPARPFVWSCAEHHAHIDQMVGTAAV